MKMKTVYLAGTIDVNNPEKVREKFNSLKARLEELNLRVLSPIRGKEICAGEFAKYESNEIVHRDLNDIDRADFVVAFMDVPSIGTAMEIIYARLLRFHPIPVVVISRSSRVHSHPWIKHFATKKLNNADQLITWLKEWLL